MQLEYTCYGTLVPFPQYGSTTLNVLVRSIQPHSYHVPVPTALQCLASSSLHYILLLLTICGHISSVGPTFCY